MSEDVVLTDQERALLRLLQDGGHVGPANAITQLDAGRALGIWGGTSTVRRRVQKIRDGLLSAGVRIESTSTGKSMGMCLSASEAHWQRYLDQVQARGISTLRKVLELDPVRVQRMHGQLTKIAKGVTPKCVPIYEAKQPDLFGEAA